MNHPHNRALLLRRRLVAPSNKKLWNPIALKARKYLSISPSLISHLTSEKYQKLNRNTLQQIFSKYLKKNPFQEIASGPKIKRLTVLVNHAKKYSAQPSYDPRHDLKFFKTIASSYNYLESLNLTLCEIQHMYFPTSIRKTQLHTLHLKFSIDNGLIYPNLLRNLKHLKHLSLQISESNSLLGPDLNAFADFLYEFTLLPVLESYSIDSPYLSSNSEEENEAFLGTLLYYLSQSKAKKFSARILCSNSQDIKIDIFQSFLESLDTLELKDQEQDNLRFNPHVIPSQRKLTLIGSRKIAPEKFINACNSLEKVWIETSYKSIPQSLRFPKSLKTLTLQMENDSRDDLVSQYGLKFQGQRKNPAEGKRIQFFEAWHSAIATLENLEEFHLEIRQPCKLALGFINKLYQLTIIRNLKRHSLQIKADHTVDFFTKKWSEYDESLREWSQNIQKLEKLEALDINLQGVQLFSLDFFEKILANCSNLKHLKLYVHQAQLYSSKENIELTTPWQKVPLLENLWIELCDVDSKLLTHNVLKDITQLENLKTLNIIGLSFDEKTVKPLTISEWSKKIETIFYKREEIIIIVKRIKIYQYIKKLYIRFTKK